MFNVTDTSSSEPYVFLAEEWVTFHKIIKTVENSYGNFPHGNHRLIGFSVLFDAKICTGREIPEASKTEEKIQQIVPKGANGTLIEEIALAQIGRMLLRNELTVPQEKSLVQREKHSKKVRWTTLINLLKEADGKA